MYTKAKKTISQGYISYMNGNNVPMATMDEQEQPDNWNDEYREDELLTRFAFYTYKDEESVLYLSNLFVEKTSRNKGIGTKILQAAEKVAETIGAISICLKAKQNSPANAWYRKRGYGYCTFEGEYDWLEKKLEYLKPKQKEQKPESCDCSRDEESYTNGIHHVLMNPEAYGLIKLKPAKWSEEFLRLMGITISQDGNQVCVLLGENLAEGIAGFGDTLADAVEEFKKEWRQFDRFRKATWKPSKEQMEALKDAFRKDGGNEYRKVINSLYCDLQKLL